MGTNGEVPSIDLDKLYKGVGFLLEHLDCDDNFCYADQETKDAIAEVGKWYSAMKKSREEKRG